MRGDSTTFSMASSSSSLDASTWITAGALLLGGISVAISSYVVLMEEQLNNNSTLLSATAENVDNKQQQQRYYWFCFPSSNSSRNRKCAKDETDSINSAAATATTNVVSDLEEEVSVAFCGNSMLYVNDCPRLLEQMLQCHYRHVVQNSCLRGGASLTSLWKRGNGMSTKFATHPAMKLLFHDKHAAATQQQQQHVMSRSNSTLLSLDNDDSFETTTTASTEFYHHPQGSSQRMQRSPSSSFSPTSSSPRRPPRTRRAAARSRRCDSSSSASTSSSSTSSSTSYESCEAASVVVARSEVSFDIGADTVQELLHERSWDFCVLQDYSQNPARVASRAAGRQALDQWYAPALERTGAVPILIQTPAYREPEVRGSEDLGTVDTFTDLLLAGYQDYAHTLSHHHATYSKLARIAPVGEAYRWLYHNYRALWEQLYSWDDVHPSPSGTWFMACVIFVTMTQRAPPVYNAQWWERSRCMQPPDEKPLTLPTDDEAALLARVAYMVCSNFTSASSTSAAAATTTTTTS